MIYGLNMLLWTTRVDDTHRPLFEAIARIGYDMVEIPVFDHADPEAYVALGDALRALGLAPSAVTALSAEQNIVSDDPAVRRAGERALDAMIDCAAALRAPFLSGPIHSAIGCSRARGRRRPRSIGPRTCWRAWRSAGAPAACASRSSRSTGSSAI